MLGHERPTGTMPGASAFFAWARKRWRAPLDRPASGLAAPGVVRVGSSAWGVMARLPVAHF
jgi:hypothetical protein